MSNGAIVLLSGGQDSTTCLLLAMEQHLKEDIYPVSFFYRQKHEVELIAAENVCTALGIRKPEVLNIEVLRNLGGGALTSDEIRIGRANQHRGTSYHEDHKLPSTVVPGRNVLFLTLAAAYGCNLGIYELWTGGCLADYEGYPDCRPEFYESMQLSLRAALDDDRVRIMTPLVMVDKADTFRIADELGQLDLVVHGTHTCYNGARLEHEWGSGCGHCPACVTRAEGWNEYKDRYIKNFTTNLGE